MNPAQIRRWARRLHEDRSRRIEMLMVRLAANGTLDDLVDHRLDGPTYVATQAEIDAEASLADDLAAALAEYGWEYDNDGVRVEMEPEVVALLARYQRART